MATASAGSFCDLKECLAINAGAATIPAEVRERTHTLCCNFLGGAWKRIDEDRIDIVRMQGGISNVLFLCKLPVGVKRLGSEPERVLLRVYFNPETESNLVAESVIFTLLSERKLGPRLYGIFNGGRLEEYIASRPLRSSEIAVPEVSLEIAQNLARIHSLVVPITKEPLYIFDALARWTAQIKETSVSIEDGKKLKKLDLKTTLYREIAVIRTCLKLSKSPVRFCHNDLQEGNILLPNDQNQNAIPKGLVFIDFEYSSYNYRAFDLANHFCEWTIDYTQEEWPHYKIVDSNFPSESDQAAFIREYLRTLKAPCDEAAVKAILEEITSFVPISHFLWAVWAYLQGELSPVPFGFAEYARSRLERYFETKGQMLSLHRRRSESGDICGLREEDSPVCAVTDYHANGGDRDDGNCA